MEYHSDEFINCEHQPSDIFGSSEVKILEMQPIQTENIVYIKTELTDNESDTDNYNSLNDLQEFISIETEEYEYQTPHSESQLMEKEAVSNLQMSEDDDAKNIETDDTNEPNKKKRNSTSKHDINITNSHLSDSDTYLVGNQLSDDTHNFKLPNDPQVFLNIKTEEYEFQTQHLEIQAIEKNVFSNLQMSDDDDAKNIETDDVSLSDTNEPYKKKRKKLQKRNSNSKTDIISINSDLSDSDTYSAGDDVKLKKAYDHKMPMTKLGRIFNCSTGQIQPMQAEYIVSVKTELSDDESDTDNYNISNDQQEFISIEKEEEYEFQTQHSESQPIFIVSDDDDEVSLSDTNEPNKENRKELQKYNSKTKHDITASDLSDSDTIQVADDDVEKKFLVSNILSLKQRVKLIKAYNRTIPIKQLCRIFNCSTAQIVRILKNRDQILKDYELQSKRNCDDGESDSSDSDNIKSIMDINVWQKELDLEKSVQVIKAYDRKFHTYHTLSRMFNCNWGQIDNIIMKRSQILKAYDEKNNRIGGERERVSNNRKVSDQNLSQRFECGKRQTKKIIDDRKAISKNYKVKNNGKSNDNEKVKSEISYNAKNPLSLKNLVKVIKAFDRKLTCKQLARIYNCTFLQIVDIIKKRDQILESYEQQSNSGGESSNDDSDNIVSLNCSENGQNELNLEISILVIDAYDRKFTYHKISRMFDCNWGQIEKIILNRDQILKVYERKKGRMRDDDEGEVESTNNCEDIDTSKNVRKSLTLEQRVQVIEAYDCKVSYNKLSRWFNQSLIEINAIIENRESILKTYREKKNCDDDGDDDAYDENVLLDTRSNNVLDLREHVKVIEAYDRKISRFQLTRIFNCTFKQINNIIKKRDTILESYGKSKRKSESSDNDRDNFKSLNNTKYHQSKSDLGRRVQVIEAYDRKLTYHKISRMFNYNWGQIENILLYRDEIIKAYEEKNNRVDIDDKKERKKFVAKDTSEIFVILKNPQKVFNSQEPVKVIEAFDRNHQHPIVDDKKESMSTNKFVHKDASEICDKLKNPTQKEFNSEDRLKVIEDFYCKPHHRIVDDKKESKSTNTFVHKDTSEICVQLKNPSQEEFILEDRLKVIEDFYCKPHHRTIVNLSGFSGQNPK